MDYQAQGIITKGVGGLYTVRLSADAPLAAGEALLCRARGRFRHDGISPLVGDTVTVFYTDRSLASPPEPTPRPEVTDVFIDEIAPRKNSLIRPPLANLDILFVTLSVTCPEPNLMTVDKLISIAEHSGIEPVLIIGKEDLGREKAKEVAALYRKVGYDVFTVSAEKGSGIDELSGYIKTHLTNRTAAFAGASGVGKSSLMKRLFPFHTFETGGLSEKTERGRNTTRHVELFETGTEGGSGFIADTPGFSSIDFVHFDFFTKEDLPLTMREFVPLIGTCRYKKCTHTKEEGCAIIEAVLDGRIPKSRHESFLDMYNALKDKHSWDKGEINTRKGKV